LERKAKLLELLPKLSESKRPADALQQCRDASMVVGAGTKKNWGNEELYAEYKTAAESLRKTIDGVKDHVAFDTTAALPVAQLGLTLFRLTAEIAERFQARKKELGALDFNDLMVRARRLLTDPARGGLRKQLASQ